MPELEVALRELGRHVEFPPTPDLASAVRGRIGERRSWRWPVAIALAVLVAALGAALAVPDARTALLDWLGLRGAEIVRVDKLPPVSGDGDLDLGRPVTLAEARGLAPWILVPEDAPDSVYFSTAIPDGKVDFIWGTPTSTRLLLTQFRAQQTFIEKLLEPGSRAERADVGDLGVWIEDDHGFAFRDRNGAFREETSRLAGNTLIWEQGVVTLRLEGNLSKDEALRIARSAG
jgi:hypothetical protein